MSLTYLEHLSGRYGSPWLVLQQLRALNCANAREIGVRVLGVPPTWSRSQCHYPRSLTDLRWLEAKSSAAIDSPALFAHVRARGLDRVAPTLVGLVAAQDLIRYCPKCLAVGYHATLFQIAALERCPWHREPLRVDCVGCGQPAWRNALVAGAAVGFACEACSRQLGPGDPRDWVRGQSFEDSEAQAFAPLASWLRRAESSPFRWRELSAELHSRTHEIAPTRFRFAVIAACVPPPRAVRDHLGSLPLLRLYVHTAVVVAWRPGMGKLSPIERDRAATLKAIRRELQWRCSKHRRCRCAAGEASIGPLRVLLPHVPWGELCPVAYALALWRARFSTQHGAGGRGPASAPRLRPDLSLRGFAHAVWQAFAEIAALVRWRVALPNATHAQMQTTLERIRLQPTIAPAVAVLRSKSVRGSVVEVFATTLPELRDVDSGSSCPLVRGSVHPNFRRR